MKLFAAFGGLTFGGIASITLAVKAQSVLVAALAASLSVALWTLLLVMIVRRI